MYVITLQHIPGYSTRDHLFVDFQAHIENWQSPQGYATPRSARCAYLRLAPQARRLSGFDGRATFHIRITNCVVNEEEDDATGPA